MNYVYAIGDYAGVTRNIYERMHKHKQSGRNVESLQILKSFIDRNEALKYEAHLHDNCNYEGKWILTKELKPRTRKTAEFGTNKPRNRKKCVFNGKEYGSLTEASKATGWSIGYIHKHKTV